MSPHFNRPKGPDTTGPLAKITQIGFLELTAKREQQEQKHRSKKMYNLWWVVFHGG